MNNEGVGRERVDELRRIYLEGKLGEYCTTLLAMVWLDAEEKKKTASMEALMQPDVTQVVQDPADPFETNLRKMFKFELWRTFRRSA